MIGNYRKKPVVIQAVQYTGTVESSTEVHDFMKQGGLHTNGFPDHILITTLEGVMRADKGDFIIKGVKGEFYPCKPDIFAATYEEVV